MAEKKTHAQVNYTYPSPRLPQEKCGKCAMIIRQTPYACKAVESPIQWNGWCKIFERAS